MIRWQHAVGRFTIKIEVDSERAPYPYFVYVNDSKGERTEEGAFQTHMEATLFIENDLRPGLEVVEAQLRGRGGDA